MSTGTIIAIVIAIIVIAAIIGIVMYLNRRREQSSLRERFGPEYDRTVEQVGDESSAGTILKERVKRVESLNIVPLSYKDQETYSTQWREVQAEFVDDPAGAVSHADDLVQEVMAKRGYPVGDFEQRAKDISVNHPEMVENYRAGHDIALQQESGSASTEDLRQAMVHYRALFEDLLRPETADMGREPVK